MSFFCDGNETIFERVKESLLPFESWEKLPKESAAAFAAFCVFRDYGCERNIKKAVLSAESDEAKQSKKYRVWRLWSTQYQWFKRAADYDVYSDKLKQTERRKTIEQREEAYREVTGKMLQVVNKKLDLMDAAGLTQGNVTEWMTAVVKTERDIFGIAANEKEGVTGCKQLELRFDNDFESL
jgi:phage terminase large subunit-like protein